MSALAVRVRRRAQAWARARQGVDRGRIVLTSRRIYILPTAQGLTFAAMIVVMLLGAMNYNNSVGLATTFALGAFALVVMHHCHRMLNGLALTLAHAPPVFAGQDACYAIRLHNPGRFRRLDIGVFDGKRMAACLSLDPGERRQVTIRVPTARRGTQVLERFSIRCRYPASLFQAWAWVNADLSCVVYPAPASTPRPPPEHASAGGSRLLSRGGDSDFAGLRDYRHGDAPRHIAWKDYARSGELRTKQFAGADLAPLTFEWADTEHEGDVEARLSRLTRWIVDADREGRRFGLTLPRQRIAPERGAAHTHACLSALAAFE